MFTEILMNPVFWMAILCMLLYIFFKLLYIHVNPISDFVKAFTDGAYKNYKNYQIEKDYTIDSDMKLIKTGLDFAVRFKFPYNKPMRAFIYGVELNDREQAALYGAYKFVNRKYEEQNELEQHKRNEKKKEELFKQFVKGDKNA